MSAIKAIKLAKLENDLLDTNREILRLEGVINSPKVKNQRYKTKCKKKLEKMVAKRTRLTDMITEEMFLE